MQQSKGLTVNELVEKLHSNGYTRKQTHKNGKPIRKALLEDLWSQHEKQLKIKSKAPRKPRNNFSDLRSDINKVLGDVIYEALDEGFMQQVQIQKGLIILFPDKYEGKLKPQNVKHALEGMVKTNQIIVAKRPGRGWDNKAEVTKYKRLSKLSQNLPTV